MSLHDGKLPWVTWGFGMCLVIGAVFTHNSPAVYAQAGTNVARSATATTNSQASRHSQTADKAIDGVIDGFPDDYTKEWVTESPIHIGGWLKLTWNSPVTINRAVLYDRKSVSGGIVEHITSGTLSFSDGTSVPVGSLNDDGSATTVSFPSRTVTSLTFTITGAGPNSADLGLMELEVFGQTGGNNSCTSASSCTTWTRVSCSGCPEGQAQEVCTAPSGCNFSRCTADTSCKSTLGTGQCDVNVMRNEQHDFRAHMPTGSSGNVYYQFNWGDGSSPARVPASGTSAVPATLTATHAWTNIGVYKVTVRALDETGKQSPDSNTLTVGVETACTNAADTTPPTVGAFSLTTRATTDLPATFQWSVADNQALGETQLWWTTDTNGQPNATGWQMVPRTGATKSVTGTTATGQFTDDPPAGTYWYGLHVTDAAGNCTTEQNQGCTNNTPNGQTPLQRIKVVKTASTSCTPGGTCTGTGNCTGTYVCQNNQKVCQCAAGSASLSLSPATQGNIAVGSTFTVDVLVNTSGKQVVAVSGYLKFDTNLLEYTGINTTASPFTIKAEETAAGPAVNLIKITRGEPTPGVTSAAALLAKVTFKAKAAGTANVTFDLTSPGQGPSRIILNDGQGTDIIATATGGTYTIGEGSSCTTDADCGTGKKCQAGTCVNTAGGGGDINGDGSTDVVDLKIILENWGVPKDPRADLNKDGKVDVLDFVQWLAYWLEINFPKK